MVINFVVGVVGKNGVKYNASILTVGQTDGRRNIKAHDLKKTVT